VNLILRTDDPAMRAAFFRLAPRWRLIDPEASARESYVLAIDLRGPVDDAWLVGSRGWIALGETPRHFQWASDRGATLFLMWPCSAQQLEQALHAAETDAPTDAVILWPDDIAWNRNTATIHNGRSLIHLTPLESEIMGVLWERRLLYTSAAEILQRVWRGSVATEQSVYVYIRNLRRKLESIPARPRILLSRYGMGYQLAAPRHGAHREELADAR
jgi:DNA-binding winged helix-turn-helix (wHTH) protein